MLLNLVLCCSYYAIRIVLICFELDSIHSIYTINPMFTIVLVLLNTTYIISYPSTILFTSNFALLVDKPVCPGPLGTVTGELVTPTSTALLQTLLTMKYSPKFDDGVNIRPAATKDSPSNFTIRKIGIGAGMKNFVQHPSILRINLRR